MLQMKAHNVTARGICYSTNENPTINNNHTTNGTGAGTFTSNLTNLIENTNYYVRAYATNSTGTAYGNPETFTTPDAPDFPGEIIFVEGGSFEMGCGTGQYDCENDESPVHTINLNDFYISKYETTNQQYADFLNETNANSDGSFNGNECIDMDDPDCQIKYSDGFYVITGKENFPVIEVSRYGANEFCYYYGSRLPTEAEWEYAARGGLNNTDYLLYSGSNTINNIAWYYGNSNNEIHETGTKNANQLGIYDMSGNVWEWCYDWYDSDYYSNSPLENPQGPISGLNYVVRGGCWYNNASFCRVANRSNLNPTHSSNGVGFRIIFHLN